jgi:hypothetical protein
VWKYIHGSNYPVAKETQENKTRRHCFPVGIFWGKCMDGLSGRVQNMWIFISQVNAHQRTSITEEALDNQVNRMPIVSLSGLSSTDLITHTTLPQRKELILGEGGSTVKQGIHLSSICT